MTVVTVLTMLVQMTNITGCNLPWSSYLLDRSFLGDFTLFWGDFTTYPTGLSGRWWIKQRAFFAQHETTGTCRLCGRCHRSASVTTDLSLSPLSLESKLSGFASRATISNKNTCQVARFFVFFSKCDGWSPNRLHCSVTSCSQSSTWMVILGWCHPVIAIDIIVAGENNQSL